MPKKRGKTRNGKGRRKFLKTMTLGVGTLALPANSVAASGSGAPPLVPPADAGASMPLSPADGTVYSQRLSGSGSEGVFAVSGREASTECLLLWSPAALPLLVLVKACFRFVPV